MGEKREGRGVGGLDPFKAAFKQEALRMVLRVAVKSQCLDPVEQQTPRTVRRAVVWGRILDRVDGPIQARGPEEVGTFRVKGEGPRGWRGKAPEGGGSGLGFRV